MQHLGGHSHGRTPVQGFARKQGTLMMVLELIKLSPLMEQTMGRPEVAIGLIDGPVVIDHPDLATENIREVPGEFAGACALSSSAACKHGTFVAGMLVAKRGWFGRFFKK
jgi:hypothetical protein